MIKRVSIIKIFKNTNFLFFFDEELLTPFTTILTAFETIFRKTICVL